MKFENSTFICDECEREYNEDDDAGNEDQHLCPVCASELYNTFIKSPCLICGKPMGKNSDAWYNSNDQYAHGKCIEKLSDNEIEDGEWSNGYD